MRIDFHTHSTASDGTWSPRRVAEEAAARRLVAWSLTDHDTIAGWREVRGAAGLIVGCEISTMHREREIHVVALGFDPDDRALADLLDEHVTIRRERATVMLERIAELRGRRLQLADCQTTAHMITRSHIADALVRAGVVRHRQEAFEDLISNANVARWYHPGYASPAEVASVVRDAGGVSVLAHPGLYGSRELVAELMGELDGIEVKHPHLDPQWQEELVDTARRSGWLRSAGSDFHSEPCRIGDWRLSCAEVGPLLEAIGHGATL